MRHHILDNSLDKLPQNPMQTTVSVFLYCADLIWSHRGQMTHTFHPVLPSSRFWPQACVTNCLDGLFNRPPSSPLRVTLSLRKRPQEGNETYIGMYCSNPPRIHLGHVSRAALSNVCALVGFSVEDYVILGYIERTLIREKNIAALFCRG